MDKSLYLYCVAEGSREVDLGVKGIGGEKVFTLAAQGLSAVVQECKESLSVDANSQNPKLLSEWVLAHQAVVDLAWEKFETIVPFGFGTVIVSKEGRSARENLIDWLTKEGESLEGKLGKLKGRAEYGIQISWDPIVVTPRVTKNDSEVQKLEGEIRSSGTGTSYLLKQKLEGLIRQRLESAADIYFKEFYQKIKDHVEEVRVEKVRKEESPRQMLANLSCLLPREGVASLGEELDKIGRIEGFFVRFTGPWPPYSFVS